MTPAEKLPTFVSSLPPKEKAEFEKIVDGMSRRSLVAIVTGVPINAHRGEAHLGKGKFRPSSRKNAISTECEGGGNGDGSSLDHPEKEELIGPGKGLTKLEVQYLKNAVNTFTYLKSLKEKELLVRFVLKLYSAKGFAHLEEQEKEKLASDILEDLFGSFPALEEIISQEVRDSVSIIFSANCGKIKGYGSSFKDNYIKSKIKALHDKKNSFLRRSVRIFETTGMIAVRAITTLPNYVLPFFSTPGTRLPFNDEKADFPINAKDYMRKSGGGVPTIKGDDLAEQSNHCTITSAGGLNKAMEIIRKLFKRAKKESVSTFSFGSAEDASNIMRAIAGLVGFQSTENRHGAIINNLAGETRFFSSTEDAKAKQETLDEIKKIRATKWSELFNPKNKESLKTIFQGKENETIDHLFDLDEKAREEGVGGQAMAKVTEIASELKNKLMENPEIRKIFDGEINHVLIQPAFNVVEKRTRDHLGAKFDEKVARGEEDKPCSIKIVMRGSPEEKSIIEEQGAFTKRVREIAQEAARQKKIAAEVTQGAINGNGVGCKGNQCAY